MSEKRLELKVGLFVLVGLVLLGALLIQFSKGTSLMRGSYRLELHAGNVGGLKPRSAVLLSGVQVGSVAGIDLAPGGKSVVIHLKVYSDYLIHGDAEFVIEQSGFLGDQYVSVIPTVNQAPVLTNNAPVYCEDPFNIQKVARSAAGFIERIDATAKKLDEAVVDVRRYALNEQTLTNLAVTIADLRAISGRAVNTVVNLDALIASNAPVISQSVSNVYAFSEEVKQFGNTLGVVLETNAPRVSASVKNIETASASLRDILAGLQAGQGLAGTMLHDEQLATNVAAIVRNLSVTTSNLNRLGLWGVMWAHKPAKSSAK
jgi:phospholipid/cholesterol/gamma-HCH transport system substrate-binding protein